MPDSFLHGSEGLSPETSDTNEGHPWKTVEPRRARAGMATRASISKLTHPAVSTPRSTTKSTAQHTKISPAAQQANERVVQAQQHGHGVASVGSPAHHPQANIMPEPVHVPEGG